MTWMVAIFLSTLRRPHKLRRMNRLIYAASEQDADLLYATGFLAPDAFLYFEKNGRRHAAFGQLEYDRARRTARVHEVINQSALVKELQSRRAGRVATPEWIAVLLRRHGIRRASVSPGFPLGLADALRKKGVHLHVAEEGLFPERVRKNARELAAIRQCLRVTAGLLRHAIDLIHRSRIGRGGILRRGGAPLTSEHLHAEIRMQAARCGFDASRPIVAGGIQACDPHERGHGPLKADELIILDIFPRDLATGYWGDMTRTVVRGRASEAQRRQFDAVRRAQKLAFEKLRAGADGQSVHQAVDGFFKERGYFTGNDKGRYEGFFHGTGHGLGLEIHEPPRVGAIAQRLRAGQVVTVEPGLYYPAVGGVRIEDVVVIQSNGCEKLSRAPIQLEI